MYEEAYTRTWEAPYIVLGFSFRPDVEYPDRESVSYGVADQA
jgi:hypothetical protein